MGAIWEKRLYSKISGDDGGESVDYGFLWLGKAADDQRSGYGASYQKL